MSFNFNARNANNNKSAFRTLITRKQAFFNRLCRRFKTSHNPAERAFLKNEAKRVINELKAFKAQWTRNGFGNNAWVTRNIKVAGMSNSNNARRTTSSYRSKTRSSARRTSRRTTTRSSRRAYAAY